MATQDEEVLGKAYDARADAAADGLPAAVLAAGADGARRHRLRSVLQLAQPYLIKLAIDRYIAAGDLAGLESASPSLFLGDAAWRRSLLEYVADLRCCS